MGRVGWVGRGLLSSAFGFPEPEGQGSFLGMASERGSPVTPLPSCPTEHHQPDPCDPASARLDELPGADGWPPDRGPVPHEHGAA